MTIDVRRYLEKKAKGLASLAKVGDAYAIAYKKFDPETGADLADEVVAVSKDNLTNQKADLQAQIAEVDAVLKDMAALV